MNQLIITQNNYFSCAFYFLNHYKAIGQNYMTLCTVKWKHMAILLIQYVKKKQCTINPSLNSINLIFIIITSNTTKQNAVAKM